MPFFEDIYRKIIFFGGDIRLLRAFPWLTWAVHDHKVSFEEVLEALPLIQYGDVGIHRDWGYLSNVAIPGFMKHAWIHTNDGIENPQMIEAISEGVVKRSPIYPMFSDYTIILSPKDVTDKQRRGACLKANSLEGENYDVNFKFDINKELEYYRKANKDAADKDLDAAAQDLKKGARYVREYDPAFSCTEVVSYAWWHRRDSLNLFLQERKNRMVIIADDFLNPGWEIKWMSKSVTVESARKYGLGEVGVGMIEEFLSKG